LRQDLDNTKANLEASKADFKQMTEQLRADFKEEKSYLQS
jgi:hypothetical protein